MLTSEPVAAATAGTFFSHLDTDTIAMIDWDVFGWVESHRTFVTSITSFITTLATLGGGFIVGQAITAKWNMRVKEREIDFDSIRRVRELYGEFLSTRRLWNYHLERSKLRTLDDRGLSLLDRCCTAEGQMEALLMKVASERKLTEKQLDDLGLFRQGYQQLRQSIRDVRPLAWGGSNHPEYLAFKRGCQSLIYIISSLEQELGDSRQFEYVTSNVHEIRWRELMKNVAVKQVVHPVNNLTTKQNPMEGSP